MSRVLPLPLVSPQPYRVRRATPADHAHLLSLLTSHAVRWSAQQLQEELARDTAASFLAEGAGSVLGTVLAHEVWFNKPRRWSPKHMLLLNQVAGEVQVLDVLVAQAHRRRGIARAMMEALCARYRCVTPSHSCRVDNATQWVCGPAGGEER